MFERFTDSAREAVVQAQVEARSLGHSYIGTEHLLLGLLADSESDSARCLSMQRVDHDQVREALVRILPVPYGDLDAEALETLGIDLSAVREKVEATFGVGALDQPGRSRGQRRRIAFGIPFTARAKKVVELSLREALRLNHKHIADGHILLGLLREGEGLAVRILVDTGVDLESLRRDVTAVLV
jgi:ATP-dependent Clp protease ATP-binding subunit ClpA